MDDQRTDELVKVLKTLADFSRLKILGLLSQRELNVGAIAAELRLTEPTISHHLARLASVDLVTMRPMGTNRLYQLNATRLAEFQRGLGLQPIAHGAEPAIASSAATDKVLKAFVKSGRLVKLPEMLKKRLVVLQWLVDKLEFGRRYSEKEINAFLKMFHDDFATLRRELIDRQLMSRENAVYWRI
jgi:hypothetical protein